MHRRNFLQLAAVASARATTNNGLPTYRIVSQHQPLAQQGMPGPYPGKVVRTHSEKAIESSTAVVDVPTVREMMSRGIQSLTGEKTERDAWARFIDAKDVVGIKLNCSGAPNIRSAPEVVAVIVENVIARGVPPKNIYLYERFLDQLTSVHYEKYVPEGVKFYTRGVSRPGNFITRLVGAGPQMASWTAMMKGISETIRARGGTPKENSFSATKFEKT